MTVQETIERVKKSDEFYYSEENQIIIQALEEVEQYRALGTVEELKEAREKQVAKKPIDIKRLIEDIENNVKGLTERQIRQIVDVLEMQPKADWIPCEVGNLIDKIFSHNEIVALWYEEPTEDVRYDKQIWRGMAWDIPKVYRECKFIKIFGTVPESIVEADTINIRIELNEEAKDVLQRKATRQQITPAYEYKEEGAENGEV